MTQWVREPQLIVWGLLFPIMFVLLFAYVFGSGIIVPGGGNYREFLMAGMFAQTMAFGIGETMMSVHTDSAKGVTDRFRSMPMAPSAVVVGRCIANMVYSAISLAILVATGLAIGWRWHGTLGEALAAFGLLLLLRLAFMWLGIWLGLKATSPEMVNSVYGMLYPVTMLSSAFIAIELMPGWLGAIATWNPISATITADPRAVRQPRRRDVGLAGRQRHADGGRVAGRDHRRHAAARRPGVPATQSLSADSAGTSTVPR